MRRVIAFGIGLAALALLVAAPAHATFPGQNGKIGFERDGDIWTMNPDGTSQVNLTNDPDYQGTPAWSPDGTKIAFTATGGDLGIMDADGSGRHIADDGNPNINARHDPAWSPDGTRIAFGHSGGAFIMDLNGVVVGGPLGGVIYDIEWSPRGDLVSGNNFGRVNCWAGVLAVAPAAGGERTILAPPSTCTNYAVFGNSFSPDAQLIAYSLVTSCDFGPPCPPEPSGLYTIRPDGTDSRLLSPTPVLPTWSPDQTKFVLGGGSIYTMNADGTGVSGPLGTGTDPDWQPVLRGYERPKAASPLYASLVPAYAACATPNRTHAAPLAFESCNPPVQTSTQLTVGTPDANARGASSVGNLRLVAVGELPIDLGNGNQSDITIDLSLTDVRNASDLSDYTGQLTARTSLRITDRANTPYPGGPGPGTVADTTFSAPVQCAATSDPAIGATCSTATTANALIPGSVIERRRAIWELGQVRVLDGNGDPFAAQGLFVP